MQIQLPKVICKRCGYIWIPRKEVIKMCPFCKSPYWDQERKRKITKKALTYKERLEKLKRIKNLVNKGSN